jgi:hypothetical protein
LLVAEHHRRCGDGDIDALAIGEVPADLEFVVSESRSIRKGNSLSIRSGERDLQTRIGIILRLRREPLMEDDRRDGCGGTRVASACGHVASPILVGIPHAIDVTPASIIPSHGTTYGSFGSGTMIGFPFRHAPR